MKRFKLPKNTYKAVFVKWHDSTKMARVWWSTGDLMEEMKKAEENDYFYSLAYLVMEKW